MKRDLIFVFILLTTLSMVNAIPHQLHKRVTSFIPCPDESPLTVSVSPDPLIPGKTATYTISGKLAKALPLGSELVVGFTDSSAKVVGNPLVADICAKTVCPTSSINTTEQVLVPAVLPDVYANMVLVRDSAKNIYGCAVAVVGGSPKAITYLRNLAF